MKLFFVKWEKAISAILSPDIVFSIIGAVLFGYWSTITTDDTARLANTVIMAILSGVAGARLAKILIEDARTGQIFTRGQSAVRGLGLILGNLGTLEIQLEKARSECNETQLGKDFMYIKNFTVAIQRQAVNSMEEWKDILPEADIRGMIDDFAKKVSDADELRDALETVQKKLTNSQSDVGDKGDRLEKLEQEKTRLEKELRKKEKEAQHIKFPLAFARPSINISSTSDGHILDHLSNSRSIFSMKEERD